MGQFFSPMVTHLMVEPLNNAQEHSTSLKSLMSPNSSIMLLNSHIHASSNVRPQPRLTPALPTVVTPAARPFQTARPAPLPQCVLRAMPASTLPQAALLARRVLLTTVMNAQMRLPVLLAQLATPSPEAAVSLNKQKQLQLQMRYLLELCWE